jgi:benzoate-CoA ligase
MGHLDVEGDEESHVTTRASGPVAGAPRLHVPKQFNIAAAVLDRHLAEGRGGRVAVRHEGRDWTYQQIVDLANRAGNALRALGVEREQRVLLVLPDSPELVAGYLGAMKIGAVAVPCNTWLNAADYRYFLRHSRARVLVTAHDIVERLRPALSDAPDLRHTVVVNGGAGAETAYESWQALVQAADARLEVADTSRDDVAFWLWTSGSTGEPKAAVHLHQDWAWCCDLYARQVLGYTESDRSFSVSKLFHAYGLGNSLMFPFWFGASTVLYPGRPTPDALYRVIHDTRPTIFFGVPTAFAAMLQVPGAEQRWDLGSLRCGVSAGEALPGAIHTRWRERFGTDILDGIGSTEVLHIYVSARPGAVVPGSSGQPVPGYDVRIVDETGRDLPPGSVGDLLVRGPSTALFYWSNAEQTRAKMRGGWFVSGDKYRCDETGHYWYAGRSDDMFKVGGEWVSPAEVEATLIEHRAVVECAVVPFDAGAGLLKPRAVVVTADGVTADAALAEELQRFVRERIAAYKCPRLVDFVAELPKTATGKIQRFKLRQAGASPEADPTT